MRKLNPYFAMAHFFLHTLWVSCLIIIWPFTGIQSQDAQSLLKQAIYEQEINGELSSAILIYERIVDEFSSERKAVAQSLLRLGRIHEKLGRPEALAYYTRISNEYPDQYDIALEARSRISELSNGTVAANEGSGEDENDPNGSGLLQISKVPWSAGPLGAISPDGRFFTYAPTNRNLAILDRTSGETRLLTPDPPRKDLGREAGSRGIPAHTLWSPDSKKIVYTWIKIGGGMDVRIYDLKRDTFRILIPYRGGPVPKPYQWLPDGSIVCSISDKKNQKAELVIVDEVTGRSRSLIVLDETDRPQRHRIGRISPSGKWLVYDPMQPNGTSDIYLMNMETGISGKIAGEDHSKEFDPLWLNDTSLVYFSNLSGTYSLWRTVINKAGRVVFTEQMVEGVGWLFHHLGLTEQKEYYYWSHVRIMNIYEADIDPVTGTMGEDRLIPSDKLGQRLSPVYSPDGQKLLFLRMGNMESSHFEIRDLVTGEERSVTFNEGSPQGFTYAPSEWTGDGKRLILSMRNQRPQVNNPELVGAVFEVGLANLEKGSIEIIASRGFIPTQLCDSVLYFKRDNAVIKLDLEKRKEDTVYHDPDLQVLHLELSRNGRHLAIFRGTKERAVYSDEVFILDTKTLEGWVAWKADEGFQFKRNHKWFSDHENILVELYQKTSSLQQFYILNIHTGKRAPLGKSRPPNEGINFVDLHPSDRKIVFTKRRSSVGPWVMRNY